jgi:hypothetical protein
MSAKIYRPSIFGDDFSNLFTKFNLLQATKSSLSENEKRERRAMERKVSEMEEELKVRRKFSFL